MGPVEIVVTLSESGPVRVSVYDVLGREVVVMLGAEVAADEHVVGVDTSGGPTGIYVVRVTAEASAASTRLVVAR